MSSISPEAKRILKDLVREMIEDGELEIVWPGEWIIYRGKKVDPEFDGPPKEEPPHRPTTEAIPWPKIGHGFRADPPCWVTVQCPYCHGQHVHGRDQSPTELPGPRTADCFGGEYELIPASGLKVMVAGTDPAGSIDPTHLARVHYAHPFEEGKPMCSTRAKTWSTWSLSEEYDELERLARAVRAVRFCHMCAKTARWQREYLGGGRWSARWFERESE